MLPRITVLEMFTTFIRFSDDRFEAWITDSRLRRSMAQEKIRSPSSESPSSEPPSSEPLSESPSQPEAFWALYWFQQWQTKAHPQAALHLSAYLQEACYWASETITQRFVSVHVSLADGFQSAIAQTDRILARYDPTYGSSLKGYARTAFTNFIRDCLRQQKAADICSDWGLLRRLSQTQVRQSLLTAGFIDIETDIATWKCFKAVCVPDAQRIASRSMRTLTAPNAALYAQIAERYNQQSSKNADAQNTDAQNTDAQKIDARAVTTSLKRTIQAARAYLNPSVTSLNQSQYNDSGSADSEHALLNTLSMPARDTPMAQMMAAETYAEQQQKWAAMGAVLQDAIAQIEPPQQALLQLYYQQQLTQKEIAHQLGIKQYQVSRQLSRVRQQLLLSVVHWSKDTLHISIESAVLANISEAIHEWLQHAYSDKVSPEVPSASPSTTRPSTTTPEALT
ncbi:MAG: sigma-70 family RNA polymerase sigma factor [Cyanobacteria bacterium J06559_1]